jgi:UDP-N-acetylmuramyl pentapeptide phosphotransferase/UDP-N-acetylglucosamine-1-phosphate transferase
MVPLIAVAVAAVISWLWCRALPVVGTRLGYLDVPGEDTLKVHTQPAIPLAAPGLLAGLLIGLAILGEFDPLLAAGLVLVAALGIVDDRLDLSPVLRLAAELAIAVLLSMRWWEDGPGLFLFGVGVIVVTINAVNLYDGLDMLAGSTGAVGLIAISLFAFVGDESPWLPLLLAAALIGFLPYNQPPAKVFLGDGGAYLLGAVTAVSIVDLGTGEGWTQTVSGLGFLGMFAVDLAVTVLRRMSSKAPLFEGDRSHIYDRMATTQGEITTVVWTLVIAHAVIVGIVAMAILALPSYAALGVVAATGTLAALTGWRWAANQEAMG